MNNDVRTYKVVDFGFQINPELPVVGYTEVVNDAVCVSHSHPRAQLIYATSGVMNVVVDNQIWVVNPLQGLWIPGGLEHQVTFQKDVNLYSIFIDPSFTDGLPTSSFSFDISIFLKQLLFKIISFGTEGNLTPAKRRIIDVFLDELTLIEPSATFLPTTNHERLQKVVELLLNDVASKNTIDHYAEISFMSSRTLSRLFIKELGMNFSDWRTRLKLLEAIKRLGEKQSIKEIALDLGYETASAFIYMFKKHLGTTPANYILEDQKL
ncbi:MULTISPECIES: AraC family transcriptional regulator [Flavobacterium]|uniref:AraC family transcriptional regulator n=1 Tax=Flavobacterium salmonis TaxID=2654844 RepID=A0A6V6YMI1_9FLAO|nr:MULTISPECIES: helix-turn-helix transcriptional regulator [Flavobacterium]OOV18175.1 AraC family transcriptional regulator [Flavobacterium sp. LM4]CAD0000690.1 AraC family transcriptional regulator [Flavobacterium salmonis]